MHLYFVSFFLKLGTLLFLPFTPSLHHIFTVQLLPLLQVAVLAELEAHNVFPVALHGFLPYGTAQIYEQPWKPTLTSFPKRKKSA